MLTSTALLKKSVVAGAPITATALTSDNLEIRYTMLLKQYALTRPAYQFWLKLEKNAEQPGGILLPCHALLMAISTL